MLKRLIPFAVLTLVLGGVTVASAPLWAQTGGITPASAVAPSEHQLLVDALVEDSKAIDVPSEVINEIIENPQQCQALMADFMVAGNSDSQARALRAVALARGLHQDARVSTDPALQDQLIQCLFRTVALTLCAPRFVASPIEEGYIPAPSTFAYDFGGVASQVAEGYSLVAPQSDALAPGQPVDREGLGTGAILFDGVSGLANIVVQVPNGRYILFLMTPMGGTGEIFQMTVNSIDYLINWAPQPEWPAGAPLVNGIGLRPSSKPVGGLAGVLALPIQVADGRCSIRFTNLPTDFPLSAMELRQEDDPTNPLYRGEDCRKLEEATYDAILAVLEDDGGPKKQPPDDPPDGGCVEPTGCVTPPPPPPPPGSNNTP